MRLLIALSWMVWSVMAQAFDWSEPVAESQLGEPLEVRLEVTNLANDTATQLFPLLASESAFAERGIQRPDYLSELTYAIDATDGRVGLVIRTATAWMQPDLSTLIEVFTPKGPIFIPVSVQIVEKALTAAVTVETQAKATSVPESPPASETTEPVAPLSENRDETDQENLVSVDETRPQTLLVRNGSTLWRLAERVQPQNVTIEQVMMALYDENPGAFEYNNVNALAKGKTLVIPSQARMEKESVLTAKRRFEAHMKAPKKDFPRTTPVAPRVLTAISGPAVTPAEPELAGRKSKSAKPEEVSTGTQNAIVSSDTATETQSIKQEPVDPVATLAPPVVTVVTPEVTELLEKITSLESKLDAMDAKFDAIRSEAKVNQLLPQVQPETSQTEFSIEDWVPTREQVEAVLATWVGKGVLVFIALVILMWIGLRAYGRRQAVQNQSIQETSIEPVGEVAAPSETHIAASEIEGQTISMAGPAALESAIERLKSKIEDPAKVQEAEELYSEGDDSLIDAFSADALNQNPEWGEDADDEADVAAHQLELAQGYLEMGMTQTAFDLLERVSVSPDQESAAKARALLNVHQS
ncbi:hypothetical protein N9Y18_01495 [Litoricolaceae bacterium]|nr:hypothetical protein [Litorivicinaceae bacterium]